MADEVFQRQRAFLDTRAGGHLRQRQAQAHARLQQVHHDQAQHQRYQRGGNKPAHGLGTDAANGSRITHAGNTHHQGGEHQRRNDHLDQAQEDVGQNGQLVGKRFDRFFATSHFTPAVAGNDTQHHGGQDHLGQSIKFHGISLYCFVKLILCSVRSGHCRAVHQHRSACFYPAAGVSLPRRAGIKTESGRAVIRQIPHHTASRQAKAAGCASAGKLVAAHRDAAQ